jgi:hypothetical protein
MFLMSKQNLNPFYWRIWRTKNYQKNNRIEKVMVPQSRKGQELKKNKPLQRPILEHPKKFIVCCSISIKV